jgi:hypothetical protein
MLRIINGAVIVTTCFIASIGIMFTAKASMAETKMVFQNFDSPSPPLNIEGVGYPTWYQGAGEGGPLTISIDPNIKKSGNSSLKLALTSGYDLYAQWNPYTGTSRDFARNYSVNPSGWQFNTYNRMRMWIYHASNGQPEYNEGHGNWYMGTYVKRVTNPNTSSDEDGGGHYYHPFNIARGQWSLCIFNTHPGHERGDPGDMDSGNVPYPTTGDPPNTYNYFDALTRFYLSEVSYGMPIPRNYWLDEIEFYKEPYVENDDQVYSICVSNTAGSNRIFLTWNRPKDENSINHEVRYAFSDIHSLGWNNATLAPNGIVTPPGYQGYNGMVYDTTSINISGKSTIYLAIKPQNSSAFSQVSFPLTGGPIRVPVAPTIIEISP